MNITSSELRQRTQYVDRSIEQGLTALRDPRLVKYLGDTTSLGAVLDGAIVANIDDGGIRIPEAHANNTDSLVVVVVRPEESVTVSPDFATQTDRQRKATVLQLAEWGNRELAERFYEQWISPTTTQGEQPQSFELSPLTFAMTSVMAVYTALYANYAETYFPKLSRKEGYLQFAKRPLMMLVMKDGQRFARPEVLGHELVHVDQYMREPVEVVRSQRSIDMNALRKELEAYNLGSVLTFLENGEQPVQLFKDEETLDWSRLQSLVDTLRQAHGVDPLDPYRPSPALLNKLSGLGEMILHQRMSFEWIEENFGFEPESL